jgi:hypothetical protein
MDPKRATPWLAGTVLLCTLAVYFITMYPSVPFWDAGEYIAVSYIMGVPHPPGTPFYVFIGKIATMLPFGNIAQRVNGLSVVAGALAVMLTFLTIVRLVRVSMGPERSRGDEWIANIGGLFGAFMLAFSDSFWENSTEAEVYALMSAAQILVFWMGLRWWEAHESKPTVGPLLVCVYIMWLSVGLHLGVGIMGLPLLVLVWLVDRKAAIVFAMPFLAVMLTSMGMEKMAAGTMLLSAGVFLYFGAQKKLNSWLALGAAAVALLVLSQALGEDPLTSAAALLGLAALVVPIFLLARSTPAGKVLGLALFLMVVGYSTHAYLPIRAAQHPAINEGNPATWETLRDLLERKQYGQMNMFERRAPLSAQLDKEFWRYFKRQWPLWQTESDARRFIPIGALLPLLLGLMGAIWQARRDRTSFLTTFTFVALTTVGMIVFLNFSPNEVRERDYFFQSGYHAFALWIGLGGAWLIGWVRDSFAKGTMRHGITFATGMLVLLMPVLLLNTLWFTHDRRGNYVAADYARNMLEPLDPNSFIFTNGDNDTFPLWYVQEVEGVRKDVRVVNLSLLNTDWYIEQLRDQEPKMPMSLSDDDIRQLGVGAVQDETGRVIYTNEYMVQHLMQQNLNPDGTWKRQPYFAVTVPNHHGFDANFTLEGLVYRVSPESTSVEIDVEVTEKALYEDFSYRGLFLEDGTWDESIYKDENASTLSRNYAAAHLQLAFHYRRLGDMKRAISEMERVSRMFPSYVDVLIPLGGFYLDAGDTASAMRLFQGLASREPSNVEARYYYAVTLVYQGNLEAALREFEAAIQVDPNYNMAYYAAYFSLKESGQLERGVAYLERWVNAHPSDEQARTLLNSERAQLGTPQQGSMGAPPPPNFATP